MLCKTSKNSQNWVTRGKSNETKAKLACILEACKSTRLRMGESLPNHHEDHVTGKGDNSLQHYNLVHKFITYASSHENSRSKSSSGQGMGKLEKIPAWDLTKSEVRKRWSMKQGRDEGRKSSFRPIDGHMSFEECRIGDKALKIKRSSCTPRWYCEDDSFAVFIEQGSSASQMTAAKVMDIISRLPGCAGKAADAVSA